MLNCNRFSPKSCKNYNRTSFADWFCPCSCKGCGKIGEALCGRCKKYIMEVELPESMIEKLAAMDKIAAEFSEMFVAGARKGSLYDCVKAYKFNAEQDLARPLAEILAGFIPEEEFVLVPLPTVRRHIRMRGFDHIDRLTEELGRLRGLETLRALRRGNDAVQVGASEEKRREQAKTAYLPAEGAAIRRDAKYLLVDDVITTGASMTEAARALRAAGAESVSAAALVINTEI